MADAKTTTKKPNAKGKAANVWTDEERAAMQESARERKASSKLSPEEERAQGEADIRAKIAEMTDAERAMAVRAGSHIVEVRASHAVLVSRPTKVTKLIEEAARATATS